VERERAPFLIAQTHSSMAKGDVPSATSRFEFANMGVKKATTNQASSL
jgi:hypothetical protein